MEYDPDIGPDPAAWLLLGEAERIRLVEAWRRRTGSRGHAGILAAVETQLATPAQAAVRTTLARLMVGGLRRQQALHAIASVLTRYAFSLAGPGSGDPTHAAYRAGLQRLDPADWIAPVAPGRDGGRTH